MASIIVEIIWLRWFLVDMGVSFSEPTPMYYDNTNVIQITRNPVSYEQTNHVKIDCHLTCHYFQSAYIPLQFENWIEFETNPLYALLHESIYCQGASSLWSAHKVRGEYESIFDAISAAKEARPVFFTGEMVFPWMFDEFNALRPFKEAAHLLAEKDDWPPLYDVKVLNNNQVPVAAAVYFEDMYVNFHLAMETSSEIGGIRLWVTNEYMHTGLRDSGSQVLDQLMGMLQGKKPWF
ncbi:uncharacterized protein LOC110029539 [Phalaenopsis equestris]|uniref:uncharacterized protein LOC110029539 n=1 Tax=Phalaenopsis equestris TaxID=78828 RepID=UPI0009E3953F|nr:uncharacterized protein LOC110029539 [Phalaenopsis equestris]